MATTLTVQQAVQRLLHRASKPGNEMSLATVAPTLQNLDGRKSTTNQTLYFDDKMAPGRNGHHSKYGGLSSNNNRISDGNYSIVGDPNFSLSSIYRDFRQNGKGNSVRTFANGDTDRIFDNGTIQDVLPRGTSNSNMDAPNLRNIVLSQWNIIKRQQQKLADKEKEIEDLRKENTLLKNALDAARSHLMIPEIAQTREIAPTAELRTRSTEKTSKAVRSPKLAQSAIVSQSDEVSGGQGIAPPKIARKKAPKKRRSRQSSDLAVTKMVDSPGSIASTGHLRSGRPRILIEPSKGLPQPEKRRRIAKSSSVDTNGRATKQLIRKALKEPKEEDVVQTPGWRQRPMVAGGVLEGTEDITDEAFSKRHQKCENEERRIIRRDKMRQREELLKEKMARLEQHQWAACRKRNKDDSESAPVQPDVNELEAIEMFEKLPTECFSSLPSNANMVNQPPRKRKKMSKK